jgi:hypothetical protein
MSSVSSTFSPDDGSSSRLGAQRARKLDHLSHAVGKPRDQLVTIRLEIEKFDHLLDAAAMDLLG